MKTPPMKTRFTAPLSAAFERLSPREQRATRLALWVVGLGLLWWWLVAPALGTLRQAPERHAKLDSQLSQMRRLAATADALRGENTTQPPSRDEALRALEQATTALGATAQLTVLGDRATLTLKGTAPEALAQWLSQARINARLMPMEAQLTRSAEANGGWNGTLVLAGPGLGTGN
ncbi:type II secretion system protein GspM [Hydrogenophaga sp.]|uniref:type II secretion system protein GspM n=1 Tax=Hydrogenophaga sp. TaxID=1904254 RepID=UPI00356325E1